MFGTRYFFYFFFGCLSILASCMPMKYGKTPAFNKYFTEFFVNDSTIQVFIRPLKFNSQEGEVAMDFTFRNNCKDSSFTKANFSFYSSQETFESFSLLTNDTLINTYPLKLLYRERYKDVYLNRLSAEIPNRDFQTMMFSENLNFKLPGKTDTLHFELRKRSDKIREKISLPVSDYLQCK